MNGNTPPARPDGNGQSDDRPNLPENEGQPESGDMSDGSGMPGGSGKGDVQVPDGNRDNGQNNSSNENSQNTDSSSSSDSISI